MGLFKKTKSKRSAQSSSSPVPVQEKHQNQPLNNHLQANIDHFKKTLGNSSDVVIREIQIGKEHKLNVGLFHVDGLADSKSIQNFIMEALLLDIPEINTLQKLPDNPIQILKESVLPSGSLKEVTDFDTSFTTLMSGNTLILVDGYNKGIEVGTAGWEHRGIQEAPSEPVIRGPRDGFTENLRTNTALIRRKIKDPNLWLETKPVGRVTKTNVSWMYIKGIVNDKVVEEVRKRIDQIDIDGILESGYIEELIQDETYTPFPTIYNSERPDVIAAGLLEGRIAILVDGTPFVLLVPAIFTQFFQAAEDYYQRSDFGLLRMLRFLAFFVSLLGPSLYIAATTFHQEMIPTTLLINLAAQREGTPLPAFVEAVIMEVTFELLREAGVRLPRAIGQTVSIVGALVIGQAAVEAGIVSAAMVIVVSITAIANFSLPAYNIGISARLLRFLLMAAAASFGIFGITVGLIAIALHLCSLRSFGVPYMSPLAPFNISDQKDTLFRLPTWKLSSRPHFIGQNNVNRAQPSKAAKPEPPKEDS